MFPGFIERTIETNGARIRTVSAGDGAPVLLLHGYPQTLAMWHHLAPVLVQNGRSVIATDLRGYGRSSVSDEDYTFRAMAADQMTVMAELGHVRFDVVAHDRGARVAHRLVLDHPESVRSVALFDILPTLDVWATMDDWLAQRYYHWTFLSQPNGLPERLINHDPVFFLHSGLGALSQSRGENPLAIFAPSALSEYEDAARRPSVVRAWCGDYATAAKEDLEHDRRDAGRTSDVPALVVWGTRGVVGATLDPIAAWSKHFPNITGGSIDAGHFLVEEEPEAVARLVIAHLSGRR
jgi:haloacetate dehalogenase